MLGHIAGIVLALVVIAIIVASYYVHRLLVMKDKDAANLVLDNQKKNSALSWGWAYPVTIFTAIILIWHFFL